MEREGEKKRNADRRRGKAVLSIIHRGVRTSVTKKKEVCRFIERGRKIAIPLWKEGEAGVQGKKKKKAVEEKKDN